ncbi:MAG: hypothetical protein ABEJ36_04665 [Candidatus Nanosalina sp.]
MTYPQTASQEEIENLAREGRFDDILDQAIEEMSEAVNVEDPEEIDLNEFEDNNVGAGDYTEDRTVNINRDPDMSSHLEHRRKEEIQGEAVYEEVMHILTTQDTYEDRHGEHRKNKQNFTFWEASANEMLGGMSRWGEKWSLESSLERAENDIPEIEVGVHPNFAVNVLTHFIGYSISQQAKNEEGYDASELARMSYDEIYNEFEEEVEEIRRGLANEIGIYVDLEGATVMRQDLEETPDEEIETREPSVYVEDENGVYGFGTFDGDYDKTDSYDFERKWHPFREVPEEAQPEIS